MSNRVLNFIIGAKDMASSVFRRVGSAIRGLFSKLLSLPTLIAGSAIAGALGKVVGAAMESERAIRKLAGALALTGDSSEKTLRDLAAFADGLQQITAFEDEAIMEAMALGMNLGVPRDRIKEVTRAAIGLASATGMDLATAMRLFGREASGAEAQLSRYGIVIEEGLSQQERLNRLVQIGAERFALATNDIKGTAGAWTQLKKSVGEFWEKLGGTVDRAFNLEAIFTRLRKWIDGIDGDRIAKAFSSAWNLVKSLFDGSVKWLDVLRGAGEVIGLSLKVGFLTAVNFLYKAFRGIVTGATESFASVGKFLFEYLKFAWSPSTWSGMAKVIIGSLGVLGTFLLDIFTAPVAAMMAGIEVAKAKFHGDSLSYKDAYVGARRDIAFFTGVSGGDSRGLVAEGGKQIAAGFSGSRDAAVQVGRDFAAGFGREMESAGIFDVGADQSRIGDLIKSTRDGLSDLAKPSLLGDAVKRAALDAKSVVSGTPKQASELKTVKDQMQSLLAPKVGSADLGQIYDAVRGQNVDVQQRIAENTRQMVEISKKIHEETKKGGIA